MINLLPGVFGKFLHQLLSCVLHLFPMLVASRQLAINILPMSVISVSWVVFVSATRLCQYVSNLFSLCWDTANLRLDVVIKYRRTINVDLFVILWPMKGSITKKKMNLWHVVKLFKSLQCRPNSQNKVQSFLGPTKYKGYSSIRLMN